MKIGICSHDFHRCNIFRWKCDGPCQNRRPFYGMVKRSMNRAPGPTDRWYVNPTNFLKHKIIFFVIFNLFALKSGGASIKILVVGPSSKSKNPKITAKRKPHRNEKSLNLLKSKAKKTSDLS